jgi:DNA uptake protein ComE-like DNA-binding protein
MLNSWKLWVNDFWQRRVLPYRLYISAGGAALLIVGLSFSVAQYYAHNPQGGVHDGGEITHILVPSFSPSTEPTVDVALLIERVKTLEATVVAEQVTLSGDHQDTAQLQSTLTKLSDQLAKVTTLLSAQGNLLQRISQATGITQQASGSDGSALGGTTTSSSGKVNINTASAVELDTLTGIGPSIAQRIIHWRSYSFSNQR